MTDGEINLAIAEACRKDTSLCPVHLSRACCGRAGYRDWCNDLNAMHEAEKVLTECADDNYAKFNNYLYHLEMIVCNAHGKDCTDYDGWSGFIAFATARQRAEAFLKTLGKWKATEGKV